MNIMIRISIFFWNFQYINSSKYTSKSNSHVNGHEKEADIIAAKNTSRKDLLKGINEVYKHMRKDAKKQLKSINDPTMRKMSLSNFNKGASEDFVKRAKSLKDNDLYNIPYYNKNHK